MSRTGLEVDAPLDQHAAPDKIRVSDTELRTGRPRRSATSGQTSRIACVS
jgi:hypothetical protein